jgi:glycosyltransferase involved in cell wall biosynthesis
MRPRVAVLFRRLGPYHIARLNAAALRCSLSVLEASDVDPTYAWETQQIPTGLTVDTILRGRTVEGSSRPDLIRGVEHALAQAKPDVVAIPGWSDPFALAALVWCLRNAVPKVLLSESSRHDRRRSPAVEWVKRRIVRAFDAALVGGSRHREYVVALGLRPGSVWDGYDVIDVEHFSKGAAIAREADATMRHRYGLPQRYWVASCRFVRTKNLPVLVRAYSEYRRARRGDAWHLVVVGDGPERRTLLDEVDYLGIKPQVTFLGFRQYAELPVFYGLAEAFVHASTVEPWGLVVNEAMASSLTVLVSNRCGCAPELVREGVNGFTFRPSDITGLAELMLRVHDMGPARLVLGQQSRAIVAEWTPERFAANLWSAAQESLSRKRCGVGPVHVALLSALARR